MTIPTEWMPEAKMKRVICHWTGGAYKASSLDRMHYHILIEEDGELVRGFRSIDENEDVRRGPYAAHTLRCNSGSVGVAVCCMAGAEEAPFDPGRFPMTEVQWERMAEVTAELCDRYGIAVTDRTVLGHGEVQRNLGIPQRRKWDPLLLPWRPRWAPERVGDFFRTRVSAALEELRSRSSAGSAEPDEVSVGVSVTCTFKGVPLPEVVLQDEGIYVRVSGLEARGWRIASAAADHVMLEDDQHVLHRLVLLSAGPDNGPAEAQAPGPQVASRRYVSVIELARVCRVPITYDPERSSLVIGAGAADADERGSLGSSDARRIVVQSGETLYGIAQRHLGNGARWTSLRTIDGKPFTARAAAQLQVGEVVVLPEQPRSQRIAEEPAVRVPAVGDAAFPPDSAAPLVACARPQLKRFALRSIPLILAECLATKVSDRAQIAYILATADHESNCGMFMRELGSRAYFERYEFRRSLGNTARGDGFRYRGRGFVQLTGRANYARWSRKLGIDLIEDPDLVASDPRIAARILVQGMIEGSFTGRRLDTYVAGDKRDFYNARSVVNGDKTKNGERISGYARRYLSGLDRSPAFEPPSQEPSGRGTVPDRLPQIGEQVVSV